MNLDALAQELAGKHPRTVLKTAFSLFDRIGLSFSGAEDVALVDLAASLKPGILVFTLDTGRLHPETYRLIEAVRTRYPIQMEVLFPDCAKVQQLVTEKGLFSFYQDGHHECCAIRKVEPLRRKLASVDAWITGQRRDQNPTRSALPEVEKDLAFGTSEHPLVKFNPFAQWSSSQVWDHLTAYDVPYNELHKKGFISIGCEPCTRPILPHQHEREGRWWWEETAKKECGLHAGNRTDSS